jgi:hypothetical protein
MDEDLSCSLDVPKGGIENSKLQFLIKKFFSPDSFLLQFLFIKTLRIRIRMRIRIDKKGWIRIRSETNADPQHCFLHKSVCIYFLNVEIL